MVDLRGPIDTAGPELTRLGSCDEMARCGSPGHYATGDNLMMWCTRPDLWGLALWGRMGFAEMRLLERVFDSGEHGGAATPCDFVLDARRLCGLDPDLYEGLASAASRRLTDIRRRVRRQAVLRSSGLIGAAMSGFYVTLDVELEWRVFTELAPALAWLDEPHPDELAARLDGLVADAISGSTLLDRLRGVLATAGGGPVSLGHASRSLGLSGRSLQRALRQLGTSFRDEAYRARIDVAKKLLLETDHKIAVIGKRLGVSSEANFISFFRRTVGESPAAWRRRNRDREPPPFSEPPCPAVAAC
jgi:AraC-like DNA-binding protein